MKDRSYNKKIKQLAVFSVIAAAVSLCGCKDKKQEGAMAAMNSAVPVQYMKPLDKPVEVWDEYTARVDAFSAVEVRARVPGYLEKVNFSEGQFVKKGDLLFVIDPRPYEAALRAAEASVKEVESRLVLAKSNYQRAKELYAANAISKEVNETRRSELLSTEAALLNAKAKLREAELDLEFTQIRAPISGRISEYYVDAGNLISANTTLLTTIVRCDIAQIYFEISERDIRRYIKSGLFKQIDLNKRTGPEVQFRLMDNENFAGTLNYYDNRMGQQTSSLTMRADFDNKDGQLMAGMFGKIKVLYEKARKALLLPEDIIGTDLVNRYVIVIDKDNVAQYRAVKVGRLLGKYRIIEEGLSPDDRVVSVGLQRAAPGTKLMPTEMKID